MDAPQSSPAQPQDSSRKWILISVAVIMLFGGYMVAEWLIGPKETFHGASEQQPPAPLVAPVAEPPINKFEQVAQYTAGKPLPTAPKPGIFLPPLDPSEHVRGDPNSPIALVEYAGMTNSFARLAQPKLKDFLEKNKDSVHWVFRHYPATKNQNDYLAGMATECVAQQLGNDAFWSYLDLLMEQKTTSFTSDTLASLGTQIGADATTLRTCVDGKDLYDRVLKPKGKAQSYLKLFVVPSFVFLNTQSYETRVVEGINTMDYMQAVLDQVKTQ